MPISSFLLERLKKIEPGAEFSGSGPKIVSSKKSYYVKLGSSQEKEQYEVGATDTTIVALALKEKTG